MRVKASFRVYGGQHGLAGKRPIELEVEAETSIRDVIRRFQAAQLSGGQWSFITESGELMSMAALSVAGQPVGRDELGKSLNQFMKDDVSVALDLVLVQPMMGGA
jgi:hypothetical protein